MTGAPAMSIGAAPESSGRRARELIALAMGAAFALACWWLTRRATRDARFGLVIARWRSGSGGAARGG